MEQTRGDVLGKAAQARRNGSRAGSAAAKEKGVRAGGDLHGLVDGGPDHGRRGHEMEERQLRAAVQVAAQVRRGHGDEVPGLQAAHEPTGRVKQPPDGVPARGAARRISGTGSPAYARQRSCNTRFLGLGLYGFKPSALKHFKPLFVR